MSQRSFRSEAQLVRSGRRLFRSALGALDVSIVTRYEVPAPGGKPDMVIARRLGGSLSYVVTVEFKLSRWKRALAQAFRNRNYANEAYVVLDASRLEPALLHLSAFRRANVGLISIGTDREIAVWHYPEPRVPFSVRFSRDVARELLAPRRTLPPDLPFTRSVRGGVALHPLRLAWGNAKGPEDWGEQGGARA